MPILAIHSEQYLCWCFSIEIWQTVGTLATMTSQSQDGWGPNVQVPM